MCVVSNVIAAGQQIWSNNPPPPLSVTYPPAPRIPTAAEWAAFVELVEKARKFDELANQADCEDPEKTAWMEAIEERLTQLEDDR